jgi:hypothetical protein
MADNKCIEKEVVEDKLADLSKGTIKIFGDRSASTKNMPVFWSSELMIVTDIEEKNKSKTIKYYFWNNVCKEVTPQEFKECCKNNGKNISKGGTEPQCIIPFIENGDTVIITSDGQIDADDVDVCDSVFKREKKEMKFVRAYLIETNTKVDSSVILPFIRNTAHQVFVNGIETLVGNKPEKLELSDYYNKPDEFLKDADKIHKQISVQNAGKHNPQLQEELSKLINNLIVCLTQNINIKPLNNKSTVDDFKKVIDLVDNKKMADIMNAGYGMMKYTDNNINFSFDGITRRVMHYDQSSSASSRLTSSAPQAECRITYEKDLMALLIKKGKPVIEQKDMVKILENPFLLLNKEYIGRIQSRLDHYIGRKSAKIVEQSPFTRADLCGFITFRGKYRSEMKDAIGRIFFGDKTPRHTTLWLAVLYFVCAQTKYLQDEEFLGGFKKFLVKELKENTYYMTLTEAPVMPIIQNCPIDVGIRYCMISPQIFKDNDEKNRMYAFSDSSKWLVELSKLIEEDEKQRAIDDRKKRKAEDQSKGLFDEPEKNQKMEDDREAESDVDIMKDEAIAGRVEDVD